MLMADAVIGPARDGGYYLVGMRPGCDALLRDIPWSTTEVAAATRRRAAAQGYRIAELPEWYDVDDRESLARALADAGIGSPLARGAAAIGIGTS